MYPMIPTSTMIAQHIVERDREDHYQRLLRIKAAWDAYDGRLPDPLRVRAGQPNDNVKLNFSRTVVDTAVDFLFGKHLAFDVEMTPLDPETTPEDAQDAETADQPAQDWLDRCWRKNKQDTTLIKLATNGAVCGTPYLKVIANAAATAPYPRIIILDPQAVQPYCASYDFEDIYRYVITWEDVNPENGKPRNHRQEIDRMGDGGVGTTWVITDYMAESGQRYQQVGPQQPWPYPWAPIHHCQNLPCPNELYGEPDLTEDTIRLNKALNFTFSNLMRIVRVYAHPYTVGKGLKATDIDRSVDGILLIQSANGLLELLQAQGIDESSINVYLRLKEALHIISQTPEIATGKLGDIGNLSGLALQILYGPLLTKTAKKQQTYGDMLAELNSHLLELGAFGSGIEVHNVWQDPLPHDPIAESQQLESDARLGVSKKTLLAKRGYDPDVEAQQRAEERKEAMAALPAAFQRGGSDVRQEQARNAPQDDGAEDA